MPSARKAVMQMNEKQRKAAIIVASILGCGALFYLGGLLGQVFTNYTTVSYTHLDVYKRQVQGHGGRLHPAD